MIPLSNELRSRLARLHQRRKARETTQLLPRDLSEDIDLERLVYKEHILSTHDLSLFPKGVDGQYIYPEGYSVYEYIEVDQLAHLAKSIKESGLVFDSDVLVSLDIDSGYWPLKKESVDKFFAWYLNYLESGYQSLSIFQSDFKKGVVVDNYCGYLPRHLSTNANEVVYEYIRWEKI